MTYVVSDIHGCLEQFRRLLKLINFLPNQDRLFILGDVLDRGPHPLSLFLEIIAMSNVTLLMGNHEEHFLQITEMLKKPADKLTSSEIKKLSDWRIDGGRTTLKEYNELSDELKQKVLDYLDHLKRAPAHLEINVNGRAFILCHGGIPLKSDGRHYVGEFTNHELINARNDYRKPYRDSSKTLITGHTPTFLIDEKYRGKIYKAYNQIAIDCGAVFGNNLGCVCLETIEEFYIKENET